jgi:hypothetical protein
MADANTGLNASPGPKSIIVEGMGASTEHSLPDQIELDKYNRANAAAKSGSYFGIRRAKFIPHGSVFNGCKQ